VHPTSPSVNAANAAKIGILLNAAIAVSFLV
jgi:hypothetical protein